MKALVVLALLPLGGCISAATLQANIAADAPVAIAITCGLNSAAVIGVAVDQAIDTTKAAAATNAKITGAAGALCAGVSNAAKQVAVAP